MTSIDTRLAALNVARSMLWVREIGENAGQAVEAILASVGLGPGQPWCAAFACWVLQAVHGKDLSPLPMVGGCATLADYAKAHGMLRTQPEVGSIFLLWSPVANRYHHAGFVIQPRLLPPPAIAQARCSTVEGNTNEDGSPEGIGVFERVRVFTPSDRFAWWWS